MHVGADGVPGAVNEIIAVTGFLDVIAGSPIHLPAGNTLTGIDRFEHGLDAGVSCVANDLKNFALLVRWRLANVSSPRNVVVDSPRRIFLAPDIEQDEIALADRGRAFGVGFVVRIAAVRVDGDHGRVIGDEILALKTLEGPF